MFSFDLNAYFTGVSSIDTTAIKGLDELIRVLGKRGTKVPHIIRSLKNNLCK